MAGKKGAGTEIGFKAEAWFLSLLNKKGIPYHYYDTWYDVEVMGYKVEIKSCRYSIKGEVLKDGTQYYRPGRFDFTDKDNREKQYNQNVWVAFILRNYEDFLLIGLGKARQFKKRRYIKAHQLRQHKIIRFEEWIDWLMKQKEKDGNKKNNNPRT